jgi:hypothetical protein
LFIDQHGWVQGSMDTSDDEFNVLDMSIDSTFAMFKEIDIAFGDSDDDEDITEVEVDFEERIGQGPRQPRLE